MSPTQRSLAKARKEGWEADIVERWMPFTARRDGSTSGDGRAQAGGYHKDMFGFVDIVAMRPDHGILAIQACGGGGSEITKRIKKILAEPLALKWLQAGASIEVWGWRRLKRKTKSKGAKSPERIVVELAVKTVTEDMFSGELQ